MSSVLLAALKKSTSVHFSPARIMGAQLRLTSLWSSGAAIGRSVDLFCTPLPGTRDRALKADLGDAQLDYLQVDDGRLAIYRWPTRKSAPLALFCHGWSSFGLRAANWAKALLAAGYSVASFDHWAHGRSDGKRATLPQFARSLQQVCAALAPIDTLIGHSLGGAAVASALAEGVSARRAILIAPAADPLAATSRFARVLGLPDQLKRDMQAELGRREGIAMEYWQAHRMAPSIATPALIIHDLEDREVGWEEGERYARYWPQAQLLSTHGLGHHRIVSDPKCIAAGIAFLRGVPVGERVVSTQALPFGIA